MASPPTHGADRPLPELAEEHRVQDFVERPFLFDDPRNVRRLLTLFGLGCVVLMALDGLVVHRHGSFEHSEVDVPVEMWWGYYGFYGFVACVLLVLAATQLRRLLMRREDYWEEDGDAR